jgi:hypothetical protein
LTRQGRDPLVMEKQLSDLEGEVAKITNQWLDWFRIMSPTEKIEVPDVNRDLVSQYAAMQFIRTADSGDILAAFAKQSGGGKELSAADKQQLHLEMIWTSGIFPELAKRIKSATWIFGRGATSIPFVSSDNPVAFRTGDHSMWLKVGIYSEGTYSVFPLAPDVVMYCHPREARWERLAVLDCCLSPVSFTEEMVDSENATQVFMASRFVISRRDDFQREREFARTIGTDVYKAYWMQKRPG